MRHQIIFHEVERSTGLLDVFIDGRLAGRIAECWPNNVRRWRVVGTAFSYESQLQAVESLRRGIQS